MKRESASTPKMFLQVSSLGARSYLYLQYDSPLFFLSGLRRPSFNVFQHELSLNSPTFLSLQRTRSASITKTTLQLNDHVETKERVRLLWLCASCYPPSSNASEQDPSLPLFCSFPNVRACLFDMDGLLIDSEDIYTKCNNVILHEHGKPSLPWKVKALLQGRPGPEVRFTSLWLVPAP